MKQVQKKSADKAVNAMLIQAKRSGTELAWDRAETQQPQCGFGRLSLCCTDCNDGPCRSNPFGDREPATVCGRDRTDLENSRFLRKVSDGVTALAILAAGYGGKLNPLVSSAILTDDDMSGMANMAGQLKGLGASAAEALKSINAVKATLAIEKCPSMDVNLGALRAEGPNILVYGHVSPQTVKDLLKNVAQSPSGITVLGACGAEGEGVLPIATNYVSQETPLLTGAVDLVLVGPQCVMPATISLAVEKGIPVVYEKNIRTQADIQSVIDQAVVAFQSRSGKPFSIPAERSALQNSSRKNGEDWAQTIVQQTVMSNGRGIAFLGGCGRIGATQDKAFVAMAEKLMQEGWRVVTAGCAGAALAKAGLCRDGKAVYLGSCHDAGLFLELAQAAEAGKINTCAIFQEITHNKVLATAVAFAVNGVQTRIDQGDAPCPAEAGCGGFLTAVEN